VQASAEIRVVIEFFGCLQHTGASGGFDGFGVVQDAGDRRCGDARFLGDGIQIHGQRILFPIATGAAEEIPAANYPQM